MSTLVGLARCQSPLELKMGQALIDICGDKLEPCADEDGVLGRLCGWKSVIACQVDLKWCWPDFLLLSLAGQLMKQGNPDLDVSGIPENAIIIEVDGHEFHERTKQQARRDRSRDREMLARGWTPMRFTGQEVYEDAEACAAQALELFIERQREVMNRAFMVHLEWIGKQKGAGRQ